GFEHPRDLSRNSGSRPGDGIADDDPETALGESCRSGVNRKPVVFKISKRVPGTARGSGGGNGGKKVVDEREKLRPRPKTPGNGLPRILPSPQSADKCGRLLHHRRIRVAEPVDRLLAIADDENRWRKGIVGGAEAFAPRSNELGDQLPLRAARILKFVDEHV